MPSSFTGFFGSRWVVCAAAAMLPSVGAGWSFAADSPETGHPIVRHYAPGEHLRDVSSQAVTQDRTGMVHFGNAGALLSYDGLNWPFHRLPTEAAGIRQFATTADGTIFVAGAGVLGYLRGTGMDATYISLADRLPAAQRNIDDVRYVAAIGDTVYFSDEARILVWRKELFTVIPYPTPLHSHGARLHRVGDTLYVTALEHPLVRLVRGRFETVADDPVLRENQIVSVEADKTARTLVLLTTERGFFHLEDGRVTPLAVDANRWLVGKRIFRALRLADGSHVVAFSAVSGDGGMRFAPDGSYVGVLDTSIGLLAKTLRDFFCDREGGLWIGLEVGAARMEWPSPASVFDVVNGLGSGGVTDIVRQDGVLYATTSEGLFRLLPADAQGRAARFERVLSGPFFSMASHPAGLLAAGYADVFVGSAAAFVSVARLPSGGGTVLASRQDPNRVWIGTTRGLQSVRHDAQSWRDEGARPGFDEGCRALSESADGSLWIATHDGGLLRLRDGRELERVTGWAGMPADIKTVDMSTVGTEPLFQFDHTPQLYRVDAVGKRFEPIHGVEALAEENASASWFASGGGDTFWLANDHAIRRVTRDGHSTRRLPHFVLAATGAVTRLYEEMGPAGNVLWVAGARGLARVDVAQAFAPPVSLTVLLRSSHVQAGERLEPEHAPLAFSFVAPRQRLGSDVQYQTRLVGRERDWSEWSAARERSFPHLPSGHYRFEVRARDTDDAISATATLAFVVLAPWWETPWALASYVAVCAAFVAGVVRLRTRALRRRAEHLERVVAERTAELAEKNRELTRLHRLESEEKIAARLAEEKARLEVLRYQLNPHFLFNTLASISSALPAGRSVARGMLDRLSEFCRLTLHRSDDREWTTLGAELKLLRTYLDIEASRWGDLLDVEFACDAALADDALPHFLLLPLVENALKYGRATSPDRVGLRIGARRESDGTLAIEVANTGEWIEPTAAKTVSSLGIGLENLRERLSRYYPRAHQLIVSHGDGWVNVTLRLSLDGREIQAITAEKPSTTAPATVE